MGQIKMWRWRNCHKAFYFHAGFNVQWILIFPFSQVSFRSTAWNWYGHNRTGHTTMSGIGHSLVYPMATWNSKRSLWCHLIHEFTWFSSDCSHMSQNSFNYELRLKFHCGLNREIHWSRHHESCNFFSNIMLLMVGQKNLMCPGKYLGMPGSGYVSG